LETVTDELIEHVREACESAESFPAAVRHSLAAFLQFLAMEPRYADFLIVEVLAAGPEPISRRKEVMDRFAMLVRRGAESLPTARRPPHLAAETVIGGIFEVVFSRVLEGQTGELPKLLPDLSYSLLLPYVGNAVARRESVKAPTLGSYGAVAA
jgi:CO dehydrogenase nickel-insertion accessory protein CooC1